MNAAANNRRSSDGLSLPELMAAVRDVIGEADGQLAEPRGFRDDVALLALKDLLAHALGHAPALGQVPAGSRLTPDTYAGLARDAYAIADAMLTARHRPMPAEDAQ